MRVVGFIALIAFLLSSCGDDNGNDSPGTDPTAYDLKIPSGFPSPRLPADNPLTVEGVDLGRHLFYEKALSIDNTVSCGSCHQQESAFADGGEAFSMGINGQQGKRTDSTA